MQTVALAVWTVISPDEQVVPSMGDSVPVKWCTTVRGSWIAAITTPESRSSISANIKPKASVGPCASKVLVVTKAGGNCCTLKQNEEEMQQVTASIAAAGEVSTDAAVTDQH